jgi:tricorn protease
MISYADNSQAIYVIDIATGKAEKIASDAVYGPGGLTTLHHSWSPDSKWLAYTRTGSNLVNVIHLWSVDQKKSWRVTDGMADAHDPVFDASGKVLFFAASTNAGPVQDWFSQSNADMRSTSSLYLAVLAKGIVSPLAKESDEEKAEEKEKAGDKKKDSDKPEAVKVTIDFDGLAERIQALPGEPAVVRGLRAGAAGKLYFMKSSSATSRYDTTAPYSLSRFDLEKRKEDTILDKLDDFEISADSKKVLVRSKDSWSISELGDKVDLAKHELSIGPIQVRIEPRAEWAQIFDEVWRINRDYFYDPGMHGADWPAMKEKYATFLPDIATRNDLNRVMRWMCSELAVGHHRLGGGDSLTETTSIPGGLLGADYVIDQGRYRFAKVYGGLNWSPELRSPLTEPGVGVKAGEVLIAVNGRELRAPQNLYSRFEATAGKIVEITVAPKVDGTGSRTVKVVPIANERNLRNRDWVEGNLRRVTEATGGRVAYVYVPNTAGMGHEYFKRYFFPQVDRDAIIIDERYNGGGQVADYYIDLLRRPYISHWAMRYGEDLRAPAATIIGPKVMIIDEFAGSGGDLLPWMFRKFGLGSLVGTTTWGGLVGILGFPTLMDGGFVTAPNIGIWTEDGFVVENVGVPPDIEVEQTPKAVIEGRDPQLEKAIEVVMRELEKNPPPKPTRPPFPVRVRK